jgi:hypothetical protein
MESNRQTNARLATRYTFDATRDVRTYDPKGKLMQQRSYKLVSAFAEKVDGSRVIEEDGEPAAAKQQNVGQGRQDATNELKKNYDFACVMKRFIHREYVFSDLPIRYLDNLFDNRPIGHELINGRDNLVVESTPKANPDLGSDRARTALDWKEITWIDVEDAMPTRYGVELLRDRGPLLKGGAFSRDFTRLPIPETGKSQSSENVWLIHSWTTQFCYHLLGSTYTLINHVDVSNYKRFQSDAHVIDDSVQEAAPPGKQP